MKIEHRHDFKPIVITLETKEEAAIFWDLIAICSTSRGYTSKIRDFAISIENWFTEKAKF